MKNWKKFASILLVLVMCLGLVACGGDTDGGDTQSGDGPVADMTSLDGMWSTPDGEVLYFDSKGGYYVYRSSSGYGGRGEFSMVEDVGKAVIDFNGFLYDFRMRDNGMLLLNQNGAGDGYNIDNTVFSRDGEARIIEWDVGDWAGMWQNALGETIVIDAASMEYNGYSENYAINGTIGDDNNGMGLYLYDSGSRAYLCPSEDGNSFTLSNGYPGRYGNDARFDGVFYRNGDIAAYTDMDSAQFYYDNDDDTCLWYYDGMNRYCLGDGYYLGEDGFAYHDGDDTIYPAGWIPEEIYDPSVNWGDVWTGELDT